MNIICINNLLPSDFQSFFFGKAIVTAVTAQSSNYCLRVTAEGANQNAQRPFFNTEMILILYSITCNGLVRAVVPTCSSNTAASLGKPRDLMYSTTSVLSQLNALFGLLETGSAAGIAISLLTSSPKI